MTAFGVAQAEFPEGCVVVFGASGALGGATAGLLAERGCDVILTYNSTRAGADDVAARITAGGREALVLQCDILDKAGVAAVIDQAIETFGRVHTVVLGTGRVFSQRAVVDLHRPDFAAQLETDVEGFLNIIQKIVPHFRAAGGGAITAIMGSSIERVLPNNALGAIPKLAQAGLIKFLAREEAANTIRVNGIAPGVIDRGMSEKVSDGDPRVIAAATQATPLGRIGTSGEIAELAVFLSSSKSGYTTGQIILSDGGLYL